MPTALRPSAALALALATVASPGCVQRGGSCGPQAMTDQTADGTFDLRADGLVNQLHGPVDPAEDAGCEALCAEAFGERATWYTVDVSSCSATLHPAPSDTDGSDTDTSDTDAHDTDPVPPDTGAHARIVGTVDVVCVATLNPTVACGRHHADLDAGAGRGPDAAAAHLAFDAHAEAASVVAFRRLAAELRDHGAPDALVQRAHLAAGDEVRHAAAVGRLARRRGGVRARVRARRPRGRSLVALALENAVEGCVHETFAAARAAWQARHAADGEVARVCARLAIDEATHADLAADLHAWALSRLTSADAARVEAARVDAWRALHDAPPIHDADAARELGLPDVAASRALIGVIAGALGAPIARPEGAALAHS